MFSVKSSGAPAVFGFVFMVEHIRDGLIARVRIRNRDGSIGWAVLGDPPEHVRTGEWVELERRGGQWALKGAA